MVKRFLLLLVAGFVFFQGCAMAVGKLVEEVSALDKPERFKPRQVDGIVKKYVSGGMTKEKVREVLTAEGLQAFEIKAKDRFPDCSDCDDVAIGAGYKFEPFLPLLPASRSLVIDIGFREGKVVIVHGWYVFHAY